MFLLLKTFSAANNFQSSCDGSDDGFICLSSDNQSMASQTVVSIRILDVNDNPPELATPYEASICEDAKPGQVR